TMEGRGLRETMGETRNAESSPAGGGLSRRRGQDTCLRMSRGRLVAASFAFFAVGLSAVLTSACSALLGGFTIAATAGDASVPDVATDGGAPDARGDAPGDGGPGADGIAPDGACAKTTCGAACVDTATDPKNCGACGHDCTGLPHVALATGVTCVGG